MTANIERNYNNLTTANIKAQLDFLEEQMNEAHDQWKLHCNYYKAGFNNLPEWEQDKAKFNCDKRRQFWFMQKEMTYNNWEQFSRFLDTTDFWARWKDMQEANK